MDFLQGWFLVANRFLLSVDTVDRYFSELNVENSYFLTFEVHILTKISSKSLEFSNYFVVKNVKLDSLIHGSHVGSATQLIII